MEYFGNKEILKNYKIGFLCSRKVPAGIILKTYDWAIKQRDEGRCIVSGFHSKIEQDVFEILLKGNQSIIMVLARSLKKRWSEEILEAVNKEHLLIISPFKEKKDRVTSEQAYKRNELIFNLSNQVFIPYVNSNSNLSKLLIKYNEKIFAL